MDKSPEVSFPAIWFLLCIVILTLFLVVFYLYFTKKACFKSCQGCDGILEEDNTSAKRSLGMTSTCCFRGLLSHIKGTPFQSDVAAEIKLARAQGRTHDSLNSINSLDDVEEAGEDNIAPSSGGISQKFRDSITKLRRSHQGINTSTGSVNQKEWVTDTRIAKSFDDSDTESSSDSDEETFRNLQKTIRKSNTSLSKTHPSHSHHQTEDAMSTETSEITERQSQTNLTPSFSGSVREVMPVDEPLVHFGESSHNRSPEHHESITSRRLSGSNDVEDRNWTVGEVESVYSREISSSLMEDDEVAAAIAVKPPMEDDDDRDDGEGVLISACGTLDIALQYFLTEKKLQITIVEANDLPSKDRGGASIIQVHAVVLPAKRKRYKTKVQHINSPHFHETFKLNHVAPGDLRGLGLRLRLYGIGKVRDRLVGEASVMFDELNLIRDPQLTITLQMEPRTDVNRTDMDQSATQNEPDVSAVATLAHGGSLPEILLSLAYDEMTGRLSVEVVKGSHFRNLSMAKPPDTFVKLILLNSAFQEMAQSKTTVRRSQPNPVFKETFYFQVAQFQLAEVSLMVSVYCNRTVKRKSMLGWISMGRNNSCEFDEQHWTEMRGAKGKVVSRWHTLIES